MSAPTESFIRAFEAIKIEVNRLARTPTSHAFEIERAASNHGAVKRNRTRLMYIRDVRNLLQHPRHGSSGHAVHISDAFLAETLALLSHLRNPPTADNVGVKRKQLKVAHVTDRLGDLADEMKLKGFSHLPIVDERDVIIGVFNEAAMFDHLWSEPETIVGRQMQISQVLDHCRLDADHTETFRFVRPGTSLDDLIEMFLSINSPTTRVGAIFVTPSGKADEPIHRLITPWDVLTPRPVEE
jgi:CBS domain-containing protein